MYVFDCSAFSFLFRNIFQDIFQRMWDSFDVLIVDGKITSTREVLREINNSSLENMRDWANERQNLFPTPTTEEAMYVRQVFENPHYQGLIKPRRLQTGGRSADSFLIARAKSLNATVITTEKWKPNAPKIPNVCDQFNVTHDNVNGFMRRERWKF